VDFELGDEVGRGHGCCGAAAMIPAQWPIAMQMPVGRVRAVA
jgi:hypothetical protein